MGCFHYIENILKWKFSTELTRQQARILVIFPLIQLFAGAVISIQGPFFPQVAREKGASSTEYGFVFGVFELVKFITAPIYGRFMGRRLEPYKVLNSGIFITSICCIIFGFLNLIDDRTSFIASALAVRIVEAIGEAAFVTASFSIITLEFPDAVATTFAVMETFYGLGMICGPVIGGCLFEVGGYTAPFATMGCLLLVSAGVTFFILTYPQNDISQLQKQLLITTQSNSGIIQLLSIPSISLTAFALFSVSTGVGFLSANLEHHLSPFSLNQLEIGSVFILEGGIYALSAPFWGKLCDKYVDPFKVSVIGTLITAISFTLVGPLPFPWITISESLPLTCTGLVIFGLGTGATLVSSFSVFLNELIDHDFDDNVATYGLASGLWTSATALGFCVGPGIGGLLDDWVGFRWGTLFIISLQLIHMIIYAIFVRITSKKPLLQHEGGRKNFL